MGNGKKHKRAKQSLRDFFKSTFLPLWVRQKNLDPKSETSYWESVTHFSNIIGKKPISELTDLDMAKFMRKMAKLPGKRKGTTMAPQSLAKHARLIATVVKVGGPRNQSNPLGQNLIEQVPCIVIPKCSKAPPKVVWSIDEIRALYDAADAMTKPVIDDISPAQWWKSFICVLWYTGIRVDAIMRVEFSAVDGHIITVPDAVSKGNKGITKYLHAEAREHIDALRRPGRIKIFDFPNWSKSKRPAYDTFTRLLDAAGIPDTRRHKKFHGLRAAHATTIFRVTRQDQLAIQLAAQACGHSNSRVTLTHYVEGDSQSQMMADAINKMPSPCGKAAAEREAAP